jgi:hypothetical protein
MKKLTVIVLVIVVFSMTGGVFAAYQDVPSGASYSDAAARVTSLGIMEDMGSSSFKPNDAVTKEQFSKIMVTVSGLGDEAASLAGSTEFSDIDASSQYSGYINEAISKGYVSGGVDGKFHPEDPVTYAQVCTAMIKALGYASQDVPGTWPKNYIEKAKALGLADGVTLASGDKVQRWAMALMLDNLLDTPVKKANPSDAAKTLAEASELTPDTMYTNYSKPEVFYRAKVKDYKLGAVDFNGNPSIVRNSVDNSASTPVVKTGEAISSNDIKDTDIVYQVTDKSGKNRFILVIDNKKTGILTGILPNKYTPGQVQIGDTTYDLDKNFNVSKLNSAYGSFSIDDYVTLLLGYDGKVVDIIYSDNAINSNYGFVINYASAYQVVTPGYNKVYTVKMLLTDGTEKTFSTSADPKDFKGELVTYEKAADGTITLYEITYDPPGEISIDKEKKLLYHNFASSNYYVMNNVKIYNVISAEADTGADAKVRLVGWGDMPSGTVSSGKILHLSKSGRFQDVNLIVTKDIVDETSTMGLVKTAERKTTSDGTTLTCTILVDGKEYTYKVASDLPGVTENSVVGVSMENDKITAIQGVKSAVSSGVYVQAIDSSRIRVENATSLFKSDMIIYFKDKEGKIKTIGKNDIKTDNLYWEVSVYLDKPAASGGMVELLYIREEP